MSLLSRFFTFFCYSGVTVWASVHHYGIAWAMKSKFTSGPNTLLDTINSISHPTDTDKRFWLSKRIFVIESINTSSMVLLLFTEIACMFLSVVMTLITGNKCCLTYCAPLGQYFTLELVAVNTDFTHIVSQSESRLFIRSFLCIFFYL